LDEIPTIVIQFASATLDELDRGLAAVLLGFLPSTKVIRYTVFSPVEKTRKAKLSNPYCAAHKKLAAERHNKLILN
jgi:hypothetical protein